MISNKPLYRLSVFISGLSILFLSTGWTIKNTNEQQGGKEKTTDEAFKNIKVLKGMPASQLMPTMHFFEASLGFDCSNCHVRGHNDSDKKPGKRKARKMIEMMDAINKNDFEGKQVVTCFTCHRGFADPEKIPAVMTAAMMTERRNEEKSDEEEIKVPDRLNTPEEIISKYEQAIGGKDAFEKLSSLKFDGVLDMGNNRTSQISIIQKAPSFYLSTIQLPFGKFERGYDGNAGWEKNPRGAQELNGGDLQDIKLTADFYAPIKFLKNYSALKFSDVKVINGDTVYVVDAKYSDLRRFKFYFDAYSGLLLRQIQYDKTLLGELQTQTDYGDYRNVNGVLFPFEMHVANYERNQDIKFNSITANSKVDNSIFNMPPK